MFAKTATMTLCGAMLIAVSASSSPTKPSTRMTGNASPSSKRWKENVRPLSGALESVKRMQGVEFDWKKDYGGKHDIGFIAEDVGNVVPALVEWEVAGKTASALKYDRITALTVEAIKAQQRQIDELREEVRKHAAKLSQHDATLAQHGDTLAKHDARLDEHESRFCSIERSLKEMKQQINELDDAIVELQQQPGCTCAPAGNAGGTAAPQ